MFSALTATWEFVPFLIAIAVFGLGFAGATWLDRQAAAKIEDQASQFVSLRPHRSLALMFREAGREALSLIACVALYFSEGVQ